ncbi:MAG: LLM class flavin-dependent oxidoreductase [Acidimicrobiales bacterium]
MRHALFTPNFGTFGDARLVSEMATRAESSGWDGWFLWDHVVHRAGNEPNADPFMTLAACAMTTDRILLGTLVTPLPRRRPWNVARQAATLDHLSGGRGVLGVGIGARGTPEITQFGEEEDNVVRGEMLDEALDVIEELWTGVEVHHSGAHYKVDGVTFLPTPVQKPLPIWVAAEWPNRKPLRRAARYQGVVPLRLEGPETLQQVLAVTGTGLDVVVHADDHPVDEWAYAGATWLLHEVRSTVPADDVFRVIDAGPAR